MPAAIEQGGTVLAAPAEELNFLHSAHTTVASDCTAFKAYLGMTAATPALLRLAFALRDRICRLAGVEAIGGFLQPRPTAPPAPGERLDFFKVVEAREERLVLSSEDRHLVVFLSIDLAAPAKGHRTLSVTASVKVHNTFGKLYMLPVGPAHRLIVRYSLSQLNRR